MIFFFTQNYFQTIHSNYNEQSICYLKPSYFFTVTLQDMV